MVAASNDRPNLMKVMQRIRVPLGFATAPLLLILARPTRYSLISGGFIALLGLATRAWASGHLRKNERLATSGPYAFTRNPLYLGTFILGTGISVCSGSLIFIVFFEIAYLAVYVPVMIAEARTMNELFASEYPGYSRLVPLFLPRITPARVGCSGPGADPGSLRFDR
ncbi:MAG TPA: isoprenylcysteine carboxylmethyltransferase family protein, partial [Blastocatellia bacterium]|nr:isoprenylcysteine carboxylmethyltransferase family protein [Blastocatellia bacterium]